MSQQRCPTCKQPIPIPLRRRRCYECREYLMQHDKWTWVELPDGTTTIKHRDCLHPTWYLTKESCAARKAEEEEEA